MNTPVSEDELGSSPETLTAHHWWRKFGAPPRTESEYSKWWLARVKGGVVVDSNGCWLWTGPLTSNGYGMTTYRSKTRILHRKVFEVFHGIKLERLEYVLHKCDVKRCCNPDHLWKGNNGLNKKDETAKGKNYWANRTHCPQGHEYTPENTHYHECRPGVMSRGCKTCELIRSRSPESRARSREYQRRRRAMKKALKAQGEPQHG